MTAMPTTLAGLSDSHYTQQQTATRQLATVAQLAWEQMPADDLRAQYEYWAQASPRVADRIAATQYENATRAAEYVGTAALVQGASNVDAPVVRPLAFLSPTDDVVEWLQAPMHHLARATLLGAPATVAKRAALSTLVRVASTLAQDAGREATGVGVAAHPELGGYYRRLQAPTCDRCAILAGRFYEWNEGFQRHPRCDCEHVPAAEKYDNGGYDVLDGIRNGEVTGLSQADYKAIVEEGADPSQVINARRPGAVSYSQMFGKRVQVTSSGNFAPNGFANLRLNGGKYRVERSLRLTPREIYRQAAGDKELARQLLYRHAYIA